MQRHPHRHLTLVVASLAALAALPGCATREQVIVKEKVVVAPRPEAIRPMPPAIREDRGTPPGPDWGWVAGHWKWEGRDWAWVHGRWVHRQVPPMPALIVEQVTIAPSPRHYWVPGHWIWRFDTSNWFWVSGHWQS